MKRIFLLVLLISLCLPSYSLAEPKSEIKTKIVYPIQQSMNYTKIWNYLKAFSYWSLEGDRGYGWEDANDYLTIEKNFTQENLCKITLVFDAPLEADYRMTFAIEKNLTEYIERTNQTIQLSYHNFTIVFDYSDLLEIPNLILSKGRKEIDGEKWFWFRVQRNGVPKNYHLELDPYIEIISLVGDGYCYALSTNWNTVHDNDEAYLTYYTYTFLSIGSYKGGLYFYIRRAFLAFNLTDVLDELETFYSARIDVFTSGITEKYGDVSICLVEGFQASPLELVDTDYDNCGDSIDNPTELSDSRIDPIDDTWLNFTLNIYGESTLNFSGISQFGLRTNLDCDDITPTDLSREYIGTCYTSEANNGYEPRLVINYLPPRYATFYYTEKGEFHVNCTLKANGTTTAYKNGTNLLLMALPYNASYIFQNFTWDATYSLTNPKILDIGSNLTIWCYFSETPIGDGEPCLYIFARFIWNITNPNANQTILFNAVDSESSHNITSYQWSWDDGASNSSGVNPTHSYSQNGTYDITLTINSEAGQDTFTQQITIGGKIETTEWFYGLFVIPLAIALIFFAIGLKKEL